MFALSPASALILNFWPRECYKNTFLGFFSSHIVYGDL